MTIKQTNKTDGKQAISTEHIEPGNDTQATNNKPIKPRNFRNTAQKEIGKKYTKIVQKLADEAVNGSVQHTKLLFDLGGVKEEVQASSSRRRRPPSLGKILLDEVKAMKRQREQNARTSELMPKDSCTGPMKEERL
jgi:hypothetical protein